MIIAELLNIMEELKDTELELEELRAPYIDENGQAMMPAEIYERAMALKRRISELRGLEI